jgi:hypothetical protein
MRSTPIRKQWLVRSSMSARLWSVFMSAALVRQLVLGVAPDPEWS